MVHAPGDLTEVQERTDGVKFRAVGWHAGPWRLLVSGVWKRPLVRLDGRETALTSPHAFSSAEGWLVLQLGGSAWVEILLPAANALNIQSQSQGRAVTVSWPAAVTDYALQWNSTLSAADSWQDSPAAVFKSGDSQYVTELTAARERFYRLRRAP
jgi:hypothetical protein